MAGERKLVCFSRYYPSFVDYRAQKDGGGRVRTLKAGDPCPCCGMPIRLTDPDALRMLAIFADMLGLPEAGEEVRDDEADPI